MSMATIHFGFANAIARLRHRFIVYASQPVEVQRWQGIDVSQRPEMKMHELLHTSFLVNTGGNNVLDDYRQDIKPNLPWADNHFEERVCGYGINPGVEWANWPGADSAKTFLDGRGMFNHNYMERYWPNHSNPDENSNIPFDLEEQPLNTMVGLRHNYGDLNSVVRHLAEEPLTRQAYLPIWFPEDTGDTHSGRKPCTLGYHFIMRDGQLDIVYYIRSCDFIRHFRDDLYLTMRLLMWVRDECEKINPDVWSQVVVGNFVMNITSLHMFRNDYIAMSNEQR